VTPAAIRIARAMAWGGWFTALFFSVVRAMRPDMHIDWLLATFSFCTFFLFFLPHKEYTNHGQQAEE